MRGVIEAGVVITLVITPAPNQAVLRAVQRIAVAWWAKGALARKRRPTAALGRWIACQRQVPQGPQPPPNSTVVHLCNLLYSAFVPQ
jgi:hypothetical protein